tara:strand:- start:844 stop:1416 length:573 start_codon:yes stop_codon:yes gene_type:complete
MSEVEINKKEKARLALVNEVEQNHRDVCDETLNISAHTHNKLNSVKTTIIACAACIILSYLSTCYVLINYGSMFWGGGDSILGLQKQLKETTEYYQSSCESVEKLAVAEREIVELKNEMRARETREMFQEVIDGLPPSSRAKWDHFVDQLKKDEEATIRHIELEHEKEMDSYKGEGGSAILKRTDGGYNN